MFSAKRAFTLIELLVVITIIVVLLALLTPALDRAIYQAELAVCGTSLRAIAGGMQLYAVDQKRRYPYRPSVAVGSNRRPHVLFFGNAAFDANPEYFADDRPTYRGYLSINKMLQCPLAPERIELEDTEPDAAVIGSYALWAGWGYSAQNGSHQGMYKLGDRFTWQDPNESLLHRFRVVADDADATHNFIQAAHPDKDGRLRPLVLQNQTAEEYSLGTPTGTYRYYTSQWYTEGNARGTMDRQFSFDDGSVERIIEVEAITDDRVTPIPERVNQQDWPAIRHYLPEN